MSLLNSVFKYLLLLGSLFVLGGCGSEVLVDLVPKQNKDSLYLAKSAPINAQIINQLRLEVGESVTFFSLIERSIGSYENIPVRWSIFGGLGPLTVAPSGKEAILNPTTIGVGYIEIEDAGITKRIAITITAGISAPIAENITPSNGLEDTEKLITLNYTDTNGDKGTSCSLSALSNIEETTPCSCDGAGVCSVGVKGITAFNGAASFNYTITAGGDTSNIASANFTIDDVVMICPTGFVETDGNNTLGTKDFCVMKYEVKNDGGGNAVSQAAGNPWVSINAVNSQTECEAIGEAGFLGTFSLISNPEWMTIARDIESVGTNWSGGSIGIGNLSRGWSAKTSDDGFENVAIASITDSTCVYNSAADTCSATGSHKLKRVNILSNGVELWDFSGNVWEWTDWDYFTPGMTTGPIDGPSGWRELNSLVSPLVKNDIGPLGNYTSSESAGRYSPSTSGGYPHRGGGYKSGDRGGLFSLGLYTTVIDNDTWLGFRCVYRPQQAPIAKTITPANANENTESIYTLSYGDVNGDLATSCQATNLTNLTETTPCSCDGGGNCTVGVTGINNYSGAANFSYTVTDNDGVSNVANANF